MFRECSFTQMKMTYYFKTDAKLFSSLCLGNVLSLAPELISGVLREGFSSLCLGNVLSLQLFSEADIKNQSESFRPYV